MPTSIIVAATVAGVGGTVAASMAAGTLTWGFAVGTFATTLALSAISGLLNKKPSAPSLENQASAQTQVVRSSVASRTVVYGRAMVSGPLVFAASTAYQSPSRKTATKTLTVDINSGGATLTGVSNLVAITAVSFTYTVTSGDGNYDEQYALTSTTGVPGRGQFLISGAIVNVNLFDANQFGTKIVVTYTYDDGIVNTANAYLHMVIPIAGHEVAGIEKIWLNDKLAYDTSNPSGSILQPFLGYLKVNCHYGSVNQTADADLIAAFPDLWTSAHRLRGVAYLYLRLQFNADVYPNGIPNVKAQVMGKYVYDPRNGGTAWSNNWALCIRDYLTSEYGINCPASEINEATFIAAANSCDESVTTINGTQARYTCDGVIDLSTTPMDAMKRLLTAGAGTVVYTQGQYKIFAGVYTAPVASLSENDLRDKISVQPAQSMKDTYNAVRGTFINPAQYWQPTDFPPVTNSTYVSQDNNVQQFRDVELAFTTDSIRAQRIAKIYLEKSRQSITVQFPAKFTAFKVGIWDRVYLSLSQMGWTNKVFIVTGWRFADGGVDLTLQEDAASSYNWNAGDATSYDTAKNTDLPDPGYVAPPGSPTATETLYVSNNLVVNRTSFAWTSAPDAFARSYELQYAPANTGTWVAAPTTSDTIQIVDNLTPGLWDIRVRTVSYFGNVSAWQTATVTLYGKTAPPRDITGLSLASLNDTTCQLTWTQTADLDVQIGGFIRVRYSPKTVGATWTNAIDVGPALPGIATNVVLPLQAGTYLVKAIDSSNNPSTNATAVTTDVPSMLGTNVITTITESPAFAGQKTNVYVADYGQPTLALTGATKIDSVGLIDDQPIIDTIGGLISDGVYEFQNTFDLGAVYPSKLTATLEVLSFDTGDYIDFRLDLIDSWSQIENTAPDNNNARLEVRTTSGDPAGTPTWSDWEPFFVGTYTARAFQFRIIISTNASNQNLGVTACSVTIDMPDRVDTGAGVVTSASVPTPVNFTLPFKATPSIGITANNLASGDYWVISNQTASGFTIIFKNSAGTQISRTFDWMAKGYGKQVA